MASNLLLIPYSIPCTHWVGRAWFCHSTHSKPSCLATVVSAISMFFVNGLALDTGIERTFLPAMHFFASKGGPGGVKVGS